MFRGVAWAGLFLSTAAVLADEPPLLLPAPQTVPKPAPPERIFLPPRRAPDKPRPDPEELLREISRLRKEREALQSERGELSRPTEAGDGAAAEAARLRLRLAELLLKLGGRGPAAPPTPEPTTVPPTPGKPPAPKPDTAPTPTGPEPPPLPPTGQFVDPVALAEALFRAGDYEAALGTYRLLDVSGMDNEKRLAIQYMTACCLRKLGKLDEAATLYREVANAKEDAILAECAQWQLGAVTWRRDLESRLQQLRQRRQALEGKP